MQHTLSLEVPDTMNKCILRIVDTSVFLTSPAPTCQLLEVTLPGFSTAIQFGEDTILPGFMINLTGCDLGIQTVNCGTTYCDLPDGIYIIKYSVSPSDYVYVEYNHLRITAALYKVQQILCELDLGACDPPDQVKAKLNQVTLIRRYLDAAKAMVEFCHQPEKGMSLYRYAIKLLDKILCNSCGGSSSSSSCTSCH